MQLDEYQREARRTDQLASEADTVKALLVPLLGLAGEAGQLLSELKKSLLTGDDRTLLTAVVKEEIGDVLWYVANIADRFGLSLDDIAFSNLVKVQNRWPTRKGSEQLRGGEFLFDDDFPLSEQLPRSITLHFHEETIEGRTRVRISFVDGGISGDHLTDNAYIDDGYRYHDAFHLAYAAILGWSPVMRRLWKRKRKSRKVVDEVEDGGRAAVIEEGIAALVFSDAVERSYYEGVTGVDSSILRVIKNMTAHLEVSVRSYRDWQEAILVGYAVFRGLRANRGGYVLVNLRDRQIEYRSALDR